MVDIPTLNKSVQEFRSLIETNNRIRDRQETKRLADIAKADQKLLEQMQDVGEKLKDLPDARKKAFADLNDKLKKVGNDLKDLPDAQELAKIELEKARQSLEKLQGLQEERKEQIKKTNKELETNDEKLQKVVNELKRQNKKVEEDAKFQKLQKEREELTKKSTDQNTQFNEEQLKIQKQELDIGKKQKAASDEHFQTNKKNLEEQKKSIIKQQKDTEKRFAKEEKDALQQQKDLKEQMVNQKDDKAKQDQIKITSQKMLGISAERLTQQEIANDTAKSARESLEAVKTELSKMGVDIEGTKKFQKEEARVKKLERAAQLKAKPLESSLIEQGKDSASALRDTFKKFLGPESFVGKLFGGIAGGLKRKVVGGIDTIFGLLKTGGFIIFLVAFAKFLQSDLWRDYKENLIPKIIDGAKGVYATLMTLFSGIFGTNGDFVTTMDKTLNDVFGEESDMQNAIRNIGLGFFGPEGGFTSGMREIFKAVFGEDSLIFQSARLLKNTFVTIATGLSDLADLLMPPYFSHKDGTPYTAGELASKLFSAFVGLTGALIALATFISPARMFLFGGKLLFRAGKWTLFKPIRRMFTALFASLGLLATQGNEIAAQTARSSGMGAKPIKGAQYKTAGGKTVTFTGKGFVDASGKKIAGAAATQLTKGIQSGSVTSIDPASRNFRKIASKYPRLGKFISVGAKSLPILGTLFTIGTGASILLDPNKSMSEKVESLGGLLFGTLGSSGLSILGGLLGTAILPGFGTILGALGGGVGGFFLGEKIGRSVMKFLLGGEPDVKGLEEEALQNSGQSFGDVTSNGANIGSGFATAAEGNKALFGDMMQPPQNNEMSLQQLSKLTENATLATDITPVTVTAGGGGGGVLFNAPQVIGGDTINNRSQTIKLIGDPDPFINKGLLSVGGFTTP